MAAAFALLQHANQQIDALLHDRAGLQVASPHLTGPIREAQVQVHALGGKGSIEGDYLKIALQHGGLCLAGALERRLGQVADHAKNKAADAVSLGQFFEAEAQITAGSKLQRQGLHGASKSVSKITQSCLARYRVLRVSIF